MIRNTQNWQQDQYVEQLLKTSYTPPVGSKSSRIRHGEMHFKIMRHIAGPRGFKAIGPMLFRGDYEHLALITDELWQAESDEGFEKLNKKISEIESAERVIEDKIIKILSEAPFVDKKQQEHEYDKLVDIIADLNPAELNSMLGRNRGALSERSAIVSEALKGLIKQSRIEDAVEGQFQEGEKMSPEIISKLKETGYTTVSSTSHSWNTSYMWSGDKKREFFEKIGEDFKKRFPEIDDRIKRFFGPNGFDINPPSFKSFFNNEIAPYVADLTDLEKAKIIEEALRLGSSAKDKDYFEIAMHYFGPQMQKFLQTIARQKGLNPEFSAILKNLESNVRSSPFSELEHVFENYHVKRIYPSQLTLEVDKPIGTGTMGQNYRGLLKLPDGSYVKVAVRLNKAQIQKAVESENAKLQKMTPAIESNPIYADTIFAHFGSLQKRLHINLLQELDTRRIAAYQSLARDAYAPLQGLDSFGRGAVADIYVPKIYYQELAEYGVLVQEFFEGSPGEEFFARHPQLLAPVMEDLTAAWVRESMFMSGYFHGDLHEGNLLFRLDPNGRVVVGVLDHGLSGALSKEQRLALMNLDIEMRKRSLADVKKILNLLKMDLRLDGMDDASLEKLVRQGLDLNHPLETLLDSIISKGGEFDAQLVNFNRGLLLVDQRLRNSGSQKSLQYFKDVVGDAVLRWDAKAKLWGSHDKRALKSPYSLKEMWELMRNASCALFYSFD